MHFLRAGVDKRLDAYKTPHPAATGQGDVTLNRLVVGDKERRADELIQAYRENGFRSVLFSHDLEKPNALYGTVYRSSVGMKYQEPVFTFRYIQKEGTLGAYNLIDNPEKFTLVID